MNITITVLVDVLTNEKKRDLARAALEINTIPLAKTLKFRCTMWVTNEWVKVFKNATNKICGRQPLTIWSITSNYLKAVSHKFYLVHSWIPWRKYQLKNSSALLRTAFAFFLYLHCLILWRSQDFRQHMGWRTSQQ